MSFDWILAPITQAGILGMGLLSSLALWMRARSDIRAVSGALNAARASSEAIINELRAEIRQLQSKSVCEPAPAPVMAAHGLNLTTRTRALRMLRRGEPNSSIAAALGVQQEEVDLLFKLDRMLEEGSAAGFSLR